MYIKNGIAYAGEQARPLNDEAVFHSVYINCGVTTWNDGSIDIAPEYLYENGVATGGEESA